MQTKIEKLSQNYINNPPLGMTRKSIQNMSESDLLDMEDNFGEEGFYIIYA